MSASIPPKSLDLRACAQKNEVLQGEAPLSAFERLLEGAPECDVTESVCWRAQAEWRQDEGSQMAGKSAQLWLRLSVQAAVPQICQRCLSAYAEPVEVDRWFRFVADEATALAQDDDCEEDLLVSEPRFDLHQLIEDELLMALPLVPMHEQCPQPPRMSAGELPLQADEDKPNPFAALAALKGGPAKS